jgi:hypothetical protein
MNNIVQKHVRLNTVFLAVNIVCLLWNTYMLLVLLNERSYFVSALVGISMAVSILAISCLLRVRGRLVG